MIGKHWLGCRDGKYNSNNFLYHCSNTKGITIALLSQFYKDAVHSWVSFRLQTNDLTSVLDENLCGNDKIRHRNTPLWFDTFSKNAIKSVKDIWDSNNKTFVDEDILLSKFIDKKKT